MVSATCLSSTEMLSGVQSDVPVPIFGAIRREGSKREFESALAPVSELMSLVKYIKVSFPFSLVEANTNNLNAWIFESGLGRHIGKTIETCPTRIRSGCGTNNRRLSSARSVLFPDDCQVPRRSLGMSLRYLRPPNSAYATIRTRVIRHPTQN